MNLPSDCTQLTKCRVCGNGNLIPVLDLGPMYLSDFVTDRVTVGRCRYPLSLVLCEPATGCGLLQLEHSVDRDKLYKHYYYRSNCNPLMIQALRDITVSVNKYVRLKPGDIVVDIGSNDNTLLQQYTEKNLTRVGFEPAKNIARESSDKQITTFNDYFSRHTFEMFFGERKAKVVTSIAMFYDLDDPNKFVCDVAEILDDDGVWIIQMSYLPSMLNVVAFDNICHEHLEYYSLKSLEYLLARHGLKVVDVELNDTNGGSFRVYIKHHKSGYPRYGKARVETLHEVEAQSNLHDLHTYETFSKNAKNIKNMLADFVKKETVRGKSIYALGASTKGNTLLQYVGLDSHLITLAAEKSRDKIGKRMVGTNIPIISQAEALKRPPDYFLVLPWHFLVSFVAQLHPYLNAGGKLLVPMPKPFLVNKSKVETIKGVKTSC